MLLFLLFHCRSQAGALAPQGKPEGWRCTGSEEGDLGCCFPLCANMGGGQCASLAAGWHRGGRPLVGSSSWEEPRTPGEDMAALPTAASSCKIPRSLSSAARETGGSVPGAKPSSLPHYLEIRRLAGRGGQLQQLFGLPRNIIQEHHSSKGSLSVDLDMTGRGREPAFQVSRERTNIVQDILETIQYSKMLDNHSSPKQLFY